jgi:Kelch motif protein
VAFSDGGTVLLAGGLTSLGSTATVLRIDLSVGTVHAVGQLVVAVHDAAGAVVGNEAIVFGGGNVSPVAVVQAAQAGKGSLLGALPIARADGVAVALGGQAIVIGGGTPARLDTAVLSTGDGVHFHSLATLIAGTRYPAVTAFDGRILAIGGTDGVHDLTAIQAIDPATGSVRVIGHLPHGLSHASALVVGGHLLVVGGRTGGRAQDSVWEIDPSTGGATVVGHIPSAMSDTAAVVVGDVGYLVGGDAGTLLSTIVSIRFE